MGECSFCYWLTQVVADEGPLNGCLCVSVCLTEFVMSCVVCLAGVLEWSREYTERSMEADSDPTDIYSRVSIHFLACCTTSQTGGRCLCVFLAHRPIYFCQIILAAVQYLGVCLGFTTSVTCLHVANLNWRHCGTLKIRYV